ncbi:alpha/beta hydrolase [Amycolatopsis acidiphila]|uniref:alpha/beta fold hydrolase n=1 Tax=Amycolatopsis acidiphila TaxID=715473 RepID=UPI0019B93274|nr:alpha/beta fold hydrolase [Amycolatopsis acidiphila]UIJ61855.1 alpha/beta hydrolase [Amycolatopsis acidiphila]GHG57541.1 alpha/beta hydrolase [Amycolatopsis acidiphila]
MIEGRFPGRDGVELAYREVGQGRPLVLIHGYFSTARVNWVAYGHAAELAGRGHRVIMPDLRAHGESAKPHDPAAYPPDVLADDGFALLEHLGLVDYDLGGYSLGARTVVRMLVRGATPGRAIVAGTGVEGIVAARRRGEHFRRILTELGTFERGSAEWKAERFLRAVGGDPVALLRLLDTFVDTSPEELARITTPVLVLVGDGDDDQGTADQLAAALPVAEYRTIPGDHMSAGAGQDLGRAIGEYLG